MDKRAERKRKAGQDVPAPSEPPKKVRKDDEGEKPRKARKETSDVSMVDQEKELSSVLGSIF